MRAVPLIIVGLGIAGATLAWELDSLGAEFLVIDRGERQTASRIAAGLVTSVTGMRLVRSWRFDEFREVAVRFYDKVEELAQTPVFHNTPMIRLLNSPEEVEYLRKRQGDPEYQHLLTPVDSLPESILAPWGAIRLGRGGQLDVNSFLAATRKMLESKERFLSGEVAWNHVQFSPDSIDVPDLELRCHQLLLADGASARGNPHFQGHEFNATRGEILTVEIPGWSESGVVHGPVWIAPLRSAVAPHHYQIGATYDWKNLDAGPTAAGRELLESRLSQMLDRPYRVTDHVASVRPILRQPVPLLARSPSDSRVIYWNGLASKGSLQAPYFAKCLARHLVLGEPLPSTSTT